MPKRSQHSRRTNGAMARALRTKSEHAQSPGDQEPVDGILVQIKKADFTIGGEQPGQVQTRPGYEVRVAIPEWEKNRSLLKSVKKGHLAQEKLLAKLQGEGTSRAWMIERFNEVDKAVAASLTTVAERIRTRRWREKERGEALLRLRVAFDDLLRWTAKTNRYCRHAERCTDLAEKELVVDAACLGILKIGELINKVERMQHGFWGEFSAAHFLDMRHKRNLIGHTDDLDADDVVALGIGIAQDIHAARLRTMFPEKAGTDQSGFLMSAKDFRELEPTRQGDKPTPRNSIAMIRINEDNRFVINRVGRSEENRILISSSVTGSVNLSLSYTLGSDPRTEPGLG